MKPGPEYPEYRADCPAGPDSPGQKRPPAPDGPGPNRAEPTPTPSSSTASPSTPSTPPILIVRPGPARSLAAPLLARRGADVLLLDRAAFPRPKACGDCMSAAATGLLDRAGLLDRVRAAGATEIDHWEIVSTSGVRASGRFHGSTALALERRRLDAVLRAAALEAGARFRQAHVTGVTLRNGRVAGVELRDGERLQADLVVGADGLRSVVARRLNLVRRPPGVRKVSLTAHLPDPGDPIRHGEMHMIPGGCVGHAPAGTGLRNLTVVVTAESVSRDDDSLSVLGPAAFFRRQLRLAPALQLPHPVRVAIEALTDDDILASGPFDVPIRHPTPPGAALVGDAAGYFDPFTGQGIYHAMAGAVALDDAVGPALARPVGMGAGAPRPRRLDRALRRYGRASRSLRAPARRVQRGVEAVLSRPWLADRVLARLAGAPAAMDRLVEVTGDLRPPASLLSPAVVSSFVIPRSGGSIDPYR